MIKLAWIFFILMICAVGSADVGWAKKDRFPDITIKTPGEIRVMVIDTGVSKHSALMKYFGQNHEYDYMDNHGHGTHIAGIVIYGNKYSHQNYPKNGLETKICDKVKLYSCKYYNPYSLGNDNLKNSVTCIRRAIELKIDIINYSGGGVEFSWDEYRAYRDFVRTGGTAVVAAGNEKKSLETSEYFPASYMFGFTLIKKDKTKVQVKALKNIFAVQNIEKDGKLVSSSNYHPRAISEIGTSIFSTLPGNRYGLMTGTSQATSAYVHRIIMNKCDELYLEDL